MKRILFISFIVFQLGCSNPKVKIVEKEKDVKMQLTWIDVDISLLREEEQQLIESYKDSTDETGYIHSKILRRISDSAQELELQKISLNTRYDSLEMELKKY